MKEYPVRINTKKESQLIVNLRKKIRKEVIGQERAIRRLLRAVASYYSGLKDPRRPIGGFIFAGPTGVGKTWTAKVFARHFLGGKNKYRDYLTRIDGSSLSREHRIAKLIGAPPGYIGYEEPNLLSQENIDAYHFDVKFGKDNGSLANKLRKFRKELQKPPRTQEEYRQHQQQLQFRAFYEEGKPYCSIILFDEIEKAHSDIWNLLLQIMEEGRVQMGRGIEETDFTHSALILTTNIGQRNIQSMISGHGQIGFRTAKGIERLDKDIYKATKEQIKKKFPPELFKRLDLIVFRPLTKENFEKILDIFLAEEEERLNERIRSFSRYSIEVKYTKSAKKFLLKEGIDIYYGVRTLRAVVEKYVRTPIANGLASKEIRSGDEILVDEKNDQLIFFRKYRQRGQNAIKHRSVAEDNPNY